MKGLLMTAAFAAALSTPVDEATTTYNQYDYHSGDTTTYMTFNARFGMDFHH